MTQEQERLLRLASQEHDPERLMNLIEEVIDQFEQDGDPYQLMKLVAA